MFEKVLTIEKMNTIIHSEDFVFFYITQPNCSVCHGLFPQIKQLLEKFPEINTYTVDASDVPAIAGTYQVFTAPTLLLFVNGSEYIREARFIQTEKLSHNIRRILQNSDSM